MSKKPGYSPMMTQFLAVKEQHPDVLLLYRMGDFYETFFEDAKIAARELELTLTSRDGGKDGERIPMAGVPHHALDNYLPRLIAKGFRVAICEQMEDPAQAKGLVRREVVRIVTPGTVLEASMLREKQNNFLAAVVKGAGAKAGFGLAYCDVSTGEFAVTELADAAHVRHELDRLGVAECILPLDAARLGWVPAPDRRLAPADLGAEWQSALPEEIRVTPRSPGGFELEPARRALHEQFGVASLEGFGCAGLPLAIRAAGAIVGYLRETQKAQLPLFARLRTYQDARCLVIDGATRKHLELTATSRDGSYKGSLLALLDRTHTAMGGRMLRGWLLAPLLDVRAIGDRHDAVEELVADPGLLRGLGERLSGVRDIERLAGRVAAGTANGRDLVALRDSLLMLPHLAVMVAGRRPTLLAALHPAPGELVALAGDILDTLVEAPPASVTEGGLIREGWSREVDDLRALLGDNQAWLAEFEAGEKARTGIKSLKVGFTKAFGYYIEITHANRHLVPAEYHRKQTLVNCERFITPELKERETAILQGEDRLWALEYELFVQLREQAARLVPALQAMGARLAALDALVALAEVAVEQHWVRPAIADDTRLEVTAGRHPVVEAVLPSGTFVPNDALINSTTDQLIVLTGPNMAGKCVAGDTLVFTDQGLVPISELRPAEAEPYAFTSLTCMVRSQVGRGQVTHFYVGGRKPTLRVRSRLGFVIEGTPDHRLWVRFADGREDWKRLEDVVPGDVVAIERRIDLWGSKTSVRFDPGPRHHNTKSYRFPTELDEDLAYVMGLLVGDGTLTYAQSFQLSTADAPLAADFARIIDEKFGYRVGRKTNGKDWFVTSATIREFLAALDLGYGQAHQKYVPRSIMRAPKPIVAAFLQGLFDTDGYASLKYGHPQLATASYRLAQEVQLLLLNFGLIASLHTKQTKRRPCHQVSVYGADAIRFYEEIGFRLARKQQRSALSSAVRMPNVGGIPHLNGLPTGRNISHDKLSELVTYCSENGVACPELEALQKSRYQYDPIVAVEVSEADVFDLSVEPDHAYVANGLVSHNSTYMRQLAHLVILGQMGSFVPAAAAHIGLVDRIFTRIGAVDDLATGQSTFMVEMNETANILNHATERSFIVLDEIGRGTSTLDGLSIAWAVAEHLAQEVRARTIFATHYHELTGLALHHPGVRNYRVLVEETEDEVIFLHRVVPGGADRSYGIEVARLAGLPPKVITRAKQVLAALEKNNKLAASLKKTLASEEVAGSQLPLFEATRS